MKTFALFALPLAASAAVLDKRQFDLGGLLGGLLGGGSSSGGAPVAGVDTLKPQIKATAQRTVTKFGPYTLNAAKAGSAPAGGMEGMMSMGMGDSTNMGQSFFLSIKKGFCNENGPCTIYGGRVFPMFEDGTPADPAHGVYIHHILSSDTSKKLSPFISSCDNPNTGAMSVSSLGTGSGFVGSGEDSGTEPVAWTTLDGKTDAGFWVEQGDSFTAWAQLVNYNPEPKKVYLAYDLEWTPGKTGSNAKGILLTAQTCASSMRIKTSTTGPANTTSGHFTFMEDGSILNARGHLHDGGVQVAMFINDKWACSSNAVYGGESGTSEVNGKVWETISEMSYCNGPIPVKKGDRMNMVIEYDLKQHPLRATASGGTTSAAEVMGMLSVMFAPKSST